MVLYEVWECVVHQNAKTKSQTRKQEFSHNRLLQKTWSCHALGEWKSHLITEQTIWVIEIRCGDSTIKRIKVAYMLPHTWNTILCRWQEVGAQTSSGRGTLFWRFPDLITVFKHGTQGNGVCDEGWSDWSAETVSKVGELYLYWTKNGQNRKRQTCILKKTRWMP